MVRSILRLLPIDAALRWFWQGTTIQGFTSPGTELLTRPCSICSIPPRPYQFLHYSNLQGQPSDLGLIRRNDSSMGRRRREGNTLPQGEGHLFFGLPSRGRGTCRRFPRCWSRTGVFDRHLDAIADASGTSVRDSKRGDLQEIRGQCRC